MYSGRVEQTRLCRMCERKVPASSVIVEEDNPNFDESAPRVDENMPYLYRCKVECVPTKDIEFVKQTGYDDVNIRCKADGYGDKVIVYYLKDGSSTTRGVYKITNVSLNIIRKKLGQEYEENKDYKVPEPSLEYIKSNFTFSSDILSRIQSLEKSETFVEKDGVKFYGCSFYIDGYHYEEIMTEKNVNFILNNISNRE